ncbi:hypothetical protein GGR52DRAFT_581875 [Hypoxylon sp. FL1284]|nr:hypothetical protein GGR52DRAFT_581875 [Hypoxylon sp. FL1284]
MEALAAVGLASNILQFIDCGYKVVRIAKELYGSGSEETQFNAEATLAAQEMRQLSKRLIKDLPTANLTEDEEALCELAQNCDLLSGKLLVLLESLKTKESQGKLGIVRTAVRNVRKKNERDQLQASLDNYRRQLSIQIGYMSRTRSFFLSLHELIETRLRQNAVLHQLRYPRMHYRFDNVEPAHRETFEWLLHGLPDPASLSSQKYMTARHRQAKQQKHREFVDWLRKGVDTPTTGDTSNFHTPRTPHKENIFHISGKPGAGKSTLMKFVCGNQTTMEHLKAWAGDKRLICARAFFWRLGEGEQKSLAGLANCLLHQILTAAPDLIPVAFPEARQSESGEIMWYSEALDRLLEDSRVFEKYKMVFFIDGLDEFQGRPIELTRKIIGWTAYSSVGIKICLSSREWNEFEVGFSDCPRLRIHEWTRDDIRIFVRDNIQDIGDLSTSIGEDELDSIARTLVYKAEGVFLWVRVVLAAIEQGVLNGDDFQGLQKKIIAFPAELRDLYQHLLDSIPEYDRENAFAALSFAGFRIRDICLLQYKFFSDLAKDRDLATNMSTQELSGEELKRLLINARRQINGRCKGHYIGDEHVRFMHSTAAKFIGEKQVQDTVRAYLGDMDILDRACQSLIAVAKSIRAGGYYFKGRLNESAFDPRFILDLDDMMRKFSLDSLSDTAHSKKRLLAFLEGIDRVVKLKYDADVAISLNVKVEYRKTIAGRFFNSQNIRALPSELVLVFVAHFQVVEYFEKGGPCDFRALLAANPEAAELVTRAAFSGVFKYSEGRRSLEMLTILFEAGISPKVRFQLHRSSTPISYQLWNWIFTRLVLAESTAGMLWDAGNDDRRKGDQYKLIELFLRYGAGEEVRLEFGPCYEVIGASRLVVLVRVGGPSGTPIDGVAFLRGICVDYQLDIVCYARKRGGVLSFRDILAYWFPDDCDHLYALLDGKSCTSPTNAHPDKVPVLFPTESRYIEDSQPADRSSQYLFDGSRPPKHCRQCFAHSEKCFADFEERSRNEAPVQVRESLGS